MEIAIGIMGGLGLFLYGMNLMGEALEKAAGSKLKKIIELLTSNIFMGVIVGTIVTAIIQSSSASMGMLVVLASQGLIPLNSALPILYGQNIGTCVTSLL